jgi:hypothetical protein
MLATVKECSDTQLSLTSQYTLPNGSYQNAHWRFGIKWSASCYPPITRTSKCPRSPFY